MIDDIRAAAVRLRETAPPGWFRRAVAIADLLEGIARGHTFTDERDGLWCAEDAERWPCDDVNNAYAVARAVLDATPPQDGDRR